MIALGSLIIFPELEDIRSKFPGVSESILNDDLAFPAMLTYLPKGLLGLVIASLIAALMSTISTHLNWGASYIVNDFYNRFIDADASQKRQVAVGRISTVILMILAAIFALFLENALGAFNILLQIGAGTGLLFLLRWFWWRINAYSEIVAMVVSFVLAVYFELVVGDAIAGHYKLLLGVGITTIAWLSTTFFTRPTDMATLKSFYQIIRPHRAGWSPVLGQMSKEEIGAAPITTFGTEILMMFLGSVLIYACLFGVGYLLYGQMIHFAVAMIIAMVAILFLKINWNKL